MTTTVDELTRAFEALVLVAVEPLAPEVVAELCAVTVDDVRATADAVELSLIERGAGYRLAFVAGGYRFQSAPEVAEVVQRFANRGVSARLSTAALETLAIVAYRQPVSRGQIASLRGVNADGVVRLLESRGYICEVGRADGPGQPILYGTTDLFLERLGLGGIDELPAIEAFLPDATLVADLEAALVAKTGDASAD